jgi:tryptophanyl-tRNA synthetase
MLSSLDVLYFLEEVMEQASRKRMVSGIKPTGKLTLGNYIGAIKQFISYQDEYDMFIFIADLHSLTLPIETINF